jgi:DUF4097 and DUF4098 domain-containing protein YvlB
VPAFDTPQPVTAEITLVLGVVRITAGTRADTVVQVRPCDEGNGQDVRAAEQTRVECAAGRLLVAGPRQRASGLFGFGRIGSIDVTVDLPAGSAVRVDAAVGTYYCRGRLGRCRLTTGCGDVEVETAGPLELRTGIGAVLVEHVDGDAELHTGSGRLRVDEVGGSTVIKNSNGDCWIGSVGGELRVNAANGDIRIDRPLAGVTARTANGDVRIGAITRGAVQLKTACGEVEFGIRAGTAALLDVSTSYGHVVNDLTPAQDAGTADETAEVRVRTGCGDIVIGRA